ncbi:MAG: cache domain-containing protein [Magnetococcales bacterium]|nr:cache domain-containing protein [Magnetococcales bacterium]
MNPSGSPTKTTTVILILITGILPLVLWFWLGERHGSAAIQSSRSRMLQQMVESRLKSLQADAVKRLADVQLLALLARSEMKSGATPASKEVIAADPTPPPPPTAIVPDPGVALAAPGSETSLSVLDEIVRLTRDFLQQQEAGVKQLASDDQLPGKLAGLDWVFRENNRQASGDRWLQFAKTFTSSLDAAVKAKAYDDLYLISAKGDIVYTTLRGGELGANVKDAGLKGSGLNRVFFRASRQSGLEDVSLYGSGDMGLAAFSAVPLQKDGRQVGVLAVRFNLPVLLEQWLSRHLSYSGVPMAVIGADGGLRFKSPLWTTLPAALQTLQSLPKTIAETPKGTMVPENSGYQVVWEHVRSAGLDWTVLVAAAASPAPITAITEPARTPTESTEPVVAPVPAPVITAQDVPASAGRDSRFGKDYLEVTGYYDLFLIHPDGRVFHTARGQEDLGTNLFHGPFADTNLGRLVRRVLDSRQPQVSDIAPYPPSHNEPAAFLAAPVIIDDKVEGVVALQRPLEDTTLLLNPGTWLGPGGDVVLVGRDLRMRSDSFLNPRTHSVTASFQGTVADNGLDLPAVHAALEGKHGLWVDSRPQGGKRLQAYAPVVMGDTTWALLVSADIPPLAADLVPKVGWRWIILIGATFLWLFLMAFLIAALGERPWKQLALIVTQLAKGRNDLLNRQDWERWHDTMGPLRQVVERCYQQTDRLSSYSGKLVEKISQVTKLAETRVNTPSAVATPSAALAGSDSLLEALARWKRRPAPALPAPATTAVEVMAHQWTDTLDRILETTNKVCLLAINAANLSTRGSTRKATLAQTFQQIRELAEQVQSLCGEGHQQTVSWKERLTLAPAHPHPKTDDQLATLLGQVERVLEQQALFIKNHSELGSREWDWLLADLKEIDQQAEKINQLVESLPQKERRTLDKLSRLEVDDSSTGSRQ